MRNNRRFPLLAIMVMGCLFSMVTPTGVTQYPRVPKAVGQAAKAKTEAMRKRSDEAWAKALPAIKAWSTKGKPYIPSAQKPSPTSNAFCSTWPAPVSL